MKSKTLFTLFLLWLGLCGAGWSEERYRYTAELEYVEPRAGGYRLWFNLRKDGNSYTTWHPVIETTHAEFARFQGDAGRLVTERIYYELIFNAEMPQAKSVHIPEMGLVTDENLRDMGEIIRARNERMRPQLSITDLIAIRPISQNQFLVINPKIIKP